MQRFIDIANGSLFDVVNPDGAAPVCIVCEHASHVIPSELADLGLAPEDRYSHAVWDPGAEALARDLSARLDAPLIVAKVSRLVYDLNRPPEASDVMPSRSGEIEVPGNRDLSDAERQARTEAIYEPFHGAVSALLDRFQSAPTFVTVHSFTPVWNGKARGTQVGLLHDSDPSLVERMLQHADPAFVTEVNKPYSAADGVTHTLRRHAITRGLPNVMIEVRNDLVTTDAEVSRMGQSLATMLGASLETGASAA